MATANKNVVSEAHARTVMGPTVGFCDASTSTSDEAVDLTAIAGQYIWLQCETADHYISFSAATGGTQDVNAATLGTALVPLIVHAGTPGIQVVVPTAAPFLTYRTISGTGIIRAIPT